MVFLGLQKYFKNRFLPLGLAFNILAFLYFIVHIKLLTFIPLVLVFIIFLKYFKINHLYSFFLFNPLEFSFLVMKNLKLQTMRLSWLLNKFTKQCFMYCILGIVFFQLVDICVGSSVSWCLLINFMIAYFCLTRHSKNLLKYHLGLYHEYNKYVIKVLEPSSPQSKEPAKGPVDLFKMFAQ